MLFPFRTSTIFRNRWVALLWAVGICFAASDIVDSLGGVSKTKPAQPAMPEAATSMPGPAAPMPPPIPNAERIVR